MQKSCQVHAEGKGPLRVLLLDVEWISEQPLQKLQHRAREAGGAAEEADQVLWEGRHELPFSQAGTATANTTLLNMTAKSQWTKVCAQATKKKSMHDRGCPSKQHFKIGIAYIIVWSNRPSI